MNDAPQILLIRLKSIGDVVFTLPAVNLVRDNFPAARISFLVSQEHAPLLEGFREVNEVIALDRTPFHRQRIAAMCAETLRLVRRLRRGRFSLVVDFQGYGETALLTWLTRAPQRWGLVHRRLRSWAYTHPVARSDRQHAIEGNLSLLAACGLQSTAVRNEFHLPENHVQAARAFFREHGCDPAKPTLHIQPWAAIERNHRMNFNFWHEEDIARRDDLGPGRVRQAKRAIDRCNQARNDAIEKFDAWLLGQLPHARPDSPLHSETPGMIIDRLSILALKLYHMHAEAARESATAEHRRKCRERLAILEEQARDLRVCLEAFLTESQRGARRFKLYRQLKMYNDATLNPQIYAHQGPV